MEILPRSGKERPRWMMSWTDRGAGPIFYIESELEGNPVPGP